MRKLIVWTTFRSPPDDVWSLITDPSELAAALPWWVRWDLSDPEGLRRALRGEDPRAVAFATRLRSLGRRVEMPVRVLDAVPDLRWKVQADNPWMSPCEHRVRLERAIGGRTRLVHEVLVGDRSVLPGRVVAEALRAAIVAVHRRLGRALHGEVGAVGSSRIYEFVEGNAAHTEDPLGRLGER